MRAARRILNGSFGQAAHPGATHCAVCGLAAPGERLGQVVSGNFTTWGLVYGDRDATCCDACAAVFRDFKFRNQVLIATPLGVDKATAGSFRAAITTPDANQQVLTFPTSRKKHCWLNAGISDTLALRIGGDDRTLSCARADAVTGLSAVDTLFGLGATKAEVKTGFYRPAVLQRAGHDIDIYEHQMAPLRAVGVLDALVWCSERQPSQGSGEPAVLDSLDRQASQLLARLANGSSNRDSDPMGFWNRGFLSRVTRRTGARSMRAFLEAVSADLGVRTPALRQTISWVESLGPDVEAGILDRIRQAPRVLIAVAQDEAKLMRGMHPSEWKTEAAEASGTIETAKINDDLNDIFEG